MLEKEIEKALVKQVQVLDGWCLKLTSPSAAGLPDRLLLMPHGRVVFVEVKRPGQKPRPLQVKRFKRLRDLGFKVYVLDDKVKIPDILKEVMTSGV